MNTRHLIFVLTSLLAVSTSVAIHAEGMSIEEQRAIFWEHAASGYAISEQDRLGMAIRELHNLQLQAERFSVDHSVGEQAWEMRYPTDLGILTMGKCCEEHGMGEPYMEQGFYPNPFSADSRADLNASAVPFGWTAAAVGKFTYLPQLSSEGNVTGYVLLLWGASPASGLDVNGDGSPDGVAELLISGGEAIRDVEGKWLDLWSGNHEEAWLPVSDAGREMRIHWQRRD